MSFDDINDTSERHEHRIVRCRSCPARIVFLDTTSGKRIPVEADTVEPEDTEFDPKRHESHFAKCPGADKHRRPR